MPNPIKYSTGSETNALKKGNFYIGTGSEGKGPSDVTGYYNGVTPQTGGYVIYMFKDGAPGNLSYHSAANDSELISFTSGLAGQTYTTVQQCFDYYYGQTDKVLVNQDYPADYPYIVMDGLVLYLDAGITQSYSGSGTVWTDINGLGPNNNGTLTNGPTYNSNDGGSIVFDGVDDYVSFSSLTPYGGTDPHNYTVWVKFNDGANYKWVINNGPQGTSLIIYDNRLGFFYDGGRSVVRATTRLTNGVWYCLSVSYLGETTVKMYVNGILDATKNTLFPTAGVSTSTWSATNINPRLGSWFGGQYDFNGSIATTQIYNRALSSDEVLQNYNATKGRFGL
jgi:hypothetical protein